MKKKDKWVGRKKERERERNGNSEKYCTLELNETF